MEEPHFLGVLEECYGPILQFLSPRDVLKFLQCEQVLLPDLRGSYCMETGKGKRKGLQSWERCVVCHKSSLWNQMIHCSKCPASYCHNNYCLDTSTHGFCDETECTNGLICLKKETGYWKCDYEQYTSGFTYECGSLYCPMHTEQRQEDPRVRVFADHCVHQRTKPCQTCGQACNPGYEDCDTALTPFCRPCAKAMPNRVFYEKYYDSYGNSKVGTKLLTTGANNPTQTE